MLCSPQNITKETEGCCMWELARGRLWLLLSPCTPSAWAARGVRGFSAAPQL